MMIDGYVASFTVTELAAACLAYKVTTRLEESGRSELSFDEAALEVGRRRLDLG